MPLVAGTRLGPYEIAAPIGAGGMGEVYRAKDTRLDRTVAIKVLPAQFSEDAERRERFEREARAVSSLNHPHICALYDVGQQDGLAFLVMEHLEGQTLADALGKGPLPTAQVLRYGIEIADALDKAHRQGIVHRDLKPGNVMVTKTGAKLLDFGLAKRSGREDAAAEVSQLATRAKPLTGEGALLGTFQYMAPEQLEGKAVDARTDIFALGSVLYEMATARKAFEAKSQASLIVAILEHDPKPLSELQPLAPAALERLVKVCLAKDPDDRLQTAHDVMQELKWIAEGTSSTAAAGPQGRSARLPLVGWIVAGVLALVVAALALGERPRPGFASPPLRLQIALPPGVAPGTHLALSPDGRYLAFPATDGGGKTMIWLRPLDSDAAAPIAGTEAGGFPFWSPDSREIAFFAGNKLKRIGLQGGSAQNVCEAADGRGGSWGRGDLILFTPDCCSGLYVVPAAGGEVQEASSIDDSAGEQSHRWPRFLPDGRRFLYLVLSAQSGNLTALFAAELGVPGRQRITQAQSSFSLEGDRLLYVKEGALVARRLDPARFELGPESPALANHVRQDPELVGLAAFSTSSTGLLAFRGGGRPQMQLVWVDRSGGRIGTVGSPGSYHMMSLSPDDRQAAVTAYSPEAWDSSVWLLSTESGRASRLTFQGLDSMTPIWSGEGRRVLFRGTPAGGVNAFYAKAAQGESPEDILLRAPTTNYPNDWSADGRYVVYESSSQETRTDLWVLPTFGDRKPRPFLATPANEAHSKLSPDGRWIAYSSDALDRPEVYVQPFPDGPGRWQVSSGGGDEPIWRRDGKELFYLSADRRLMAAAVRAEGGRFEATPPRELFKTPLPPLRLTGNPGHYAASRDGQRFLLVVPAEEAPAPITLLVNWPATLEP